MKISEERPWVVLVDDEAEVLSALLRCLRNEPYEVLTTCLPERALRQGSGLPRQRQVAEHPNIPSSLHSRPHRSAQNTVPPRRRY